MCRGEARQHGRGRWLQCLTPVREAAAAVPVERAKKSQALVVLGAGSRNFNGVYLFEGALEGDWTDGDRYCKRNGTEALTYYSGWWLFTADGSGDSCYGVRANAAAGAAPPRRGWCVKHGKGPAPCLELFGSLKDVPLELRGADIDESCALEVRGAGSTEFDGVYRLCRLHQSKFCYRKDGGDQTIIYTKGWWVMNENGCGESAYGLHYDKPDAMPPSGAAWGFKKAQAPAPSVRFGVYQEGGAVVSAVASGTHAASPAPTLPVSVLQVSNARSLEESVDLQSCKEHGSLASTSASGTVNKEDGSLVSTSACGTVNKGDGFLASTSSSETVNKENGSLASSSAGGTVHDADLDGEKAIISKADGRVFNESDDAAAEHQVASEAPLVPTLNKTPPRAGLVSQRLTEFAKLSQGMPARSFATAECMPDRGLVSQRIQQHQRFIKQA